MVGRVDELKPQPAPAGIEAALQEALEERNRLWHDAQRAHALEHDLRQCRRELDDITGSFSWRVTAPVRGVKDAVVPRARRVGGLARKARAQLRG
jgi:hypothetical protein